MNEREALKLALEALQFALHVGFPESSESQIKKGEKAYQQHRAAITAIKEALAQPEQEPKCGAIIQVFGKDWRLEYLSLPVGKHKLYTQQYTYTTPPQRTWVGLTEREQGEIMEDLNAHGTNIYKFARAIEAKLKAKNSL